MSFYLDLQEQTAAARKHLLAAPIIQGCLRGEVSLASYLAFLQEAYHHVRHTVPLLRACKAALPARQAWLNAPLDEYVAEEQGHDEWILDDIRACGGDAEAVRRGRPGHAAEVMVAYAYDTIARGNPLGFFGMVHVLEGTSVALALLAADQIQKPLRLPDAAFSYLRSHGTLDREHTAHLAAADGPHRRSARPGRYRPRRARLLPPVRRCVPRLAAAVRRAGLNRRGGGSMKAAQARILLTGAGGGIGREAAAAFVRAGAAVMLAGRTPARLSAQARALGGGAPCELVHGRPAGPGQIAAPGGRGCQWGCNVVVHSAGTPRLRRAAGAGSGRHDAGAAHEPARAHGADTSAAWAPARGSRGRRCCSWALRSGGIGLPGYSVYCATKFGLRGFAEALRRELAGTRGAGPVPGPAQHAHRLQRRRGRGVQPRHRHCDGRAVHGRGGDGADARGRERERFLGFPEKLAVRINGLAPTLLDGSFRRHSRSIAASISTSTSNPESMTT